MSGPFRMHLKITALAVALQILNPSAHAANSCKAIFDAGSRVQGRSVRTPKVNAAHHRGTVTIAGPWDLATKQYDSPNGIPMAVTITPPEGTPYAPYPVLDLHYPLPDGRIGIHLIPVVDRKGYLGQQSYEEYPIVGKTAAENGVESVEVRGAEVLDSHIRKVLGLGPADDIFALISNTNATQSLSTPFSQLKALVQNRIGHTGAYLGEARTLHSPEGYSTSFNNGGRPSIITTISLHGVPQAQLNRNAKIVTTILHGVEFPPDYKFDYMRQVTLKETLDFYRGWIDPTFERNPGEGPLIAFLKNRQDWALYCKEFTTVITNVALNLPHTERGFQSIWGMETGSRLFALAKEKYKAARKQDMPEVTDFATLWQQRGIANPLQMNFRGQAMAWEPLTVADLLNGVVTQYAHWKDIGPVLSSLTVLKFYEEANNRIGVDQQTYMRHAFPLMVQMLKHDAAVRLQAIPRGAHFDAAFAKYVHATTVGFQAGLSEAPPEVAAMLVPALTAELEKAKSWISEHRFETQEQAIRSYNRATARLLVPAQGVQPTHTIDQSVEAGVMRVADYTPPHVVQLMANGVWQTDPLVTVRNVATAVQASEVIYRNTEAREIQITPSR